MSKSIVVADGPAGGSKFEVDRTPKFLRLAVDLEPEFRWVTSKGESLKPGEVGYAYEKIGRSEPGCDAVYMFVNPQPLNNQLRDFGEWEKWVYEKLGPDAGKAKDPNGEPGVPASTSAQA